MQKDFSIENVTRVISRLENLNLDSEFAYEEAIRLYAQVGLPIRAVGPFGRNETTRVFRSRVVRDKIPISLASDVGIPPEKIKIGRCNPGAKPKFYGASNPETSFFETVPAFIKSEGLNPGEDFYVYMSQWLITEPFELVSLVSPIETSWTTQFDREQGLRYQKVLLSDISKTDEEKEGAMRILDYVANSFKKSEQEDPNVYVKTAAFLGYLFSIDFIVKGVFYQSVANIEKGYNVAIHSSFYEQGGFRLINVNERHYRIIDASNLMFEQIEPEKHSHIVMKDGIVNWP